MKKILLSVVALICSLITNAETWSSIGFGEWQDPYWCWPDNGEPISGIVEVEKSDEKSFDHYRFKSNLDSSPYIYIRCGKNTNEVFVEKYQNTRDSRTVTVAHECVFNLFARNMYGTLKNREIRIPGLYFYKKTEPNRYWEETCRHDFILKLPPQGNDKLPSGIYFGITAFNHLPKIKPIELLDETNRHSFTSFVDSQRLDDYTYLYYSVEQAIKNLVGQEYPKDLNSVGLITFTDGNDDGSLEMVENTSWTDLDYQEHVRNLINSGGVQGYTIDAFSIGLKGKDIGSYNYDLFKSNLSALASSPENVTEVSNISEVDRALNKIIDNLEKSWLNKKLSIRINMRATGDKIRFTLDKSRNELDNDPANSDLWIEGVFSRNDNSLNNIVYHGLTSSSGRKVLAEKVTVDGKTKYQFTFENLLDANGNQLNTKEINFWHTSTANPIWQPHTEFGGQSDVTTETERNSAAVMFVMDCSSSLGKEDFSKLKDVVNSLIERLSNKISNGVDTIVADENADAPEEYYNLQGMRVTNPANGIFIYRKGNKVKKVYIK